MSGFSCQSSSVTHIWKQSVSQEVRLISHCECCNHTFLNVLNPANILPPIQVLYFRSGGANILIRVSLGASFCTSCSSRSPKPFVSVAPPDRMMFEYRDFLRSMSVLLIASTMIWCSPGYSSPINSGSNIISGARNRSGPSYRFSLA